MPRIDIDQDVYNHIAKHTQTIGEDASSILRRLLQLAPERGVPNSQCTIAPNIDTQNREEASNEDHSSDRVSEFLQGRAFTLCENPTDRFLCLLTWVYSHHHDSFDRVQSIRGHQRVYFSQSEIEIANSGHGNAPQKIPGSPWFVETNNSTPTKQDLANRVLGLFDYQLVEKTRLTNAIDAGPEIRDLMQI